MGDRVPALDLPGGILRGEGAAKEGMFGGLVSTVTNIVLDPLFISVFRLGVGSAAVATAVSALRQGVLLIPLLYLMEALFQLDGPPLAHVAADLCSIVISLGCAGWFLRQEGHDTPAASSAGGASCP